MTKYDPLKIFLAGSSQKRIPANFGEIETIIGSRLPPSAFKYRAWWSNNADNHVNARAWLGAGYETDQVDMTSQTLIFRRLGRAGSPPSPMSRPATPASGGILARVQDALRGTVRFAPGFDATTPTDERWDAQEVVTRPILLDTCALLWIGNASRISAQAQEALEEVNAAPGAIMVSPISSWEIGQLVARGRLILPIEPLAWFLLAIENGFRLSPMTPAILVGSSFLPGSPLRDPGDRIIAATARALGYRLMTRDRPLLQLAAEGHIQAIAC